MPLGTLAAAFAAYSAISSATGGSQGTQAGGTIYDPFASSRPQYQTLLSQAIGQIGSTGTPQQYGQIMNQYGALGQQYGNIQQQFAGLAPQYQQAVAPSFNINNLASNPTLQYLMQQGTNSVNANMAAQGLGNSGAAKMALAQQTEGIAGNFLTQEQQLGQQQSALNLQSVQGQQAALAGQLSSLGGVAGTISGQQGALGASSSQQLNYGGLLAQLAGANLGASPTNFGANQSQGLGALAGLGNSEALTNLLFSFGGV